MDLVGFPMVYGAGRWKGTGSCETGGGGILSPRQRASGLLRANLWQESKAGGLWRTRRASFRVFEPPDGRDIRGDADFPPARRLGAEVSIVHPLCDGCAISPTFRSWRTATSLRATAIVSSASPPDFVSQRYFVFNSAGHGLPGVSAAHLFSSRTARRSGWTATGGHGSSSRLGGSRRARQSRVCRSRDRRVDALRDEVRRGGLAGSGPGQFERGGSARYPRESQRPSAEPFGMEAAADGFIGTFDPWHWAEVLAQAVRPVAAAALRTHFLFVGDGSGIPRVRGIIAREGVEDRSRSRAWWRRTPPRNTWRPAISGLAARRRPGRTPFFGS